MKDIAKEMPSVQNIKGAVLNATSVEEWTYEGLETSTSSGPMSIVTVEMKPASGRKM